MDCATEARRRGTVSDVELVECCAGLQSGVHANGALLLLGEHRDPSLSCTRIRRWP